MSLEFTCVRLDQVSVGWAPRAAIVSCGEVLSWPRTISRYASRRSAAAAAASRPLTSEREMSYSPVYGFELPLEIARARTVARSRAYLRGALGANRQSF